MHLTLPFLALRAFLDLLAQQTPGNPVERPADYQPYIFKAYAAACVLLFLFTLWAAIEERRLARRVDYLARRLEEAKPGSGRAV